SELRHALGRALTDAERLATIRSGTIEVRQASQFGELILIAAYLPVLTLAGVEGKMFRPMALTVIFALVGALVLSATLIPALCAMFLREERVERHNPVLVWLEPRYEAFLRAVLRRPAPVLAGSLLVIAAAFGVGSTLGAEFLPELDEGSLAVNHVRLKSVPLTETVRQSQLVEETLREFPEVETVVSRIGRPAIATDPMGPEMVDTYVMLKPADQWTPGRTRESLVEAMEEELARLPGMAFSFSQPIKFRMMELIEGIGIRADVGVKIYGDDLEVLQRLARQVAGVVRRVPGAEDVKEPELSGLPVLEIRLDREALARHGLNVADAQEVIGTAIAGTQATEVLEGFTRLDLMVRLPEWARDDVEAIASLPLLTPDGRRIPLSQVARIEREQGPSEVSREGGRRRVAVEANVRARDIGSFVEEARERVRREVELPPGYV
ncbi:MAG: efflux RND transporter permease subunit, partial [Candidatus Methylomirabilis sp.]|nr:efflux RND transporter permease subunit [Deltaproteobacteria bacterium]